MIQEPARIQATTYVAAPKQKNEKAAGETTYSPNCTCSQKRTTQTAPMTDSPMSTSTTIPIVINTQPNPRIILIRVPTSTNNTSNTSNRTEQSPPRTRLIRIPFLPGSVPTPSPVKLALPQTSSKVSPKASALTGTIYKTEVCSNNSFSQLNRVAKGHIGPVTTMKMVKEAVQVSSPPKTLASMAGIQLTGADGLQVQDMSGAMPTATVEEIDVPVFIDEYLQNIEATSSTTSSSSKSEENGKEICTETDILDFDFDINLIAEDHIERKAMDQCNLNMDSNYNNNNDDLDLLNDFELPLLDEVEEAFDISSMCHGIDITNELSEEPDLDLLTSSENPMFGTFSQTSVISSSQTKIFNETPMLANENSMDDNYYICSQASLGFGHIDMDNDSVCMTAFAPSALRVGVKRTASAALLDTIIESKPAKSNKLFLNINKSMICQDVINTPDIINAVLDFDEENSSTTIIQNTIYEDIRNAEDNTTFTNFQDFSAPSTPFSVSTNNSYVPNCQTVNASPNSPASPAYSTASTSRYSTSTSQDGRTKRKRGRPAKEHADGPDAELMSQMTDEERKIYQDRIKNNEASRVSRRKTKKREEEEKSEEDNLQSENERLSNDYEKLIKRRKRYVDYLRQNHHSNSTYVKAEPDH